MKRNLLSMLVIVVVSFLFAINASGQGLTTSAFNGVVKDPQGVTLPGATIVATHRPSGTKYTTITRDDGRYNLPNVRSGGPYTIVVSFVGFQDFVENNVQVPLGEDFEISPVLQEENITLGAAVVRATSDKTFNSNSMGAKTNIGQGQINAMPTISRSLNDFSRLTPQASVTSSGVSFSGTNNRYNSFQIDGTVNNDVFGLSSGGTNGASAGTTPISLDAIQELQVVIAPFDVRQSGFTGGGINAITKSGTNEFHGSVYGFGNNENTVGKTNGKVAGDGKRSMLGEQKEYTYGVTFGGPIIKDKLFFFANYEHNYQSNPTSNDIGKGSNITVEEADRIVNTLKRISGGYDGGGYAPLDVETKSDKFLARVDWNINDIHKLTVRYSYVDASRMNFSRSNNVLRLSDNGYKYNSKTHSFVGELNSRFSNTLFNELRVGYNRIRDYRDIMGKPFPYIRVDLSSSIYAEMGTERYSMANKLNQDIISLEDNLSFYLGSHTLTVGTHNEFFRMYNVFIRENYGSYRYSSLDDFEKVGTPGEVLPKEYNYSYSDAAITGSTQWAPTFNAMQLGFYLQDEWTISKQLKVSYGIRMDIPIFLDKPIANNDFNNTGIAWENEVKTNQLPKSTPLWSPRIGFNWDVTGDRSTQIRGGAGIFTGRIPFVWISNSFSNTGVEYGRVRINKAADFPAGFAFNPDPNSPPTGVAIKTTEIDVAAKNFKFPQVIRLNLAIDQKLPWGMRGSLEGIYSKKMNDVVYRNINIEKSGKYFNNFEDKRPLYSSNIDPNYTSVILLDNTNEGYSYSLTGKLEKSFDFGLNAMVAYTFGKSKDINSGTSSQAYSGWSYNEQWRGSNNPEMSYSDFDVRHRIIGSLSYNVQYGKHFGTTVSLFYNGQSGQNYSVCYANDINGDGVNGNDVMYVPTNAQIDQMNFKVDAKLPTVDAQRAALKEFIGSHPGLKDKRGEYAERNSLRSPFEHHFDLRLAQDFYININGRRTTLQFTVDVMNVMNLLNKNWGVAYSPLHSYTPLKVEGVAADGTPTFSFDNKSANPLYGYDDKSSRWRAQFGLRFIF